MNKFPDKFAGWLFPAALVLLWALFHHRVLFGGNTFVLADSSRFFFPLWKWGSAVWARGSIPLWNPDAGFGTPYLADPQMAAWYPPVYLFYHFCNPVNAFNLLITGHHLLALLGFYHFARKKGFPRGAAFNGSLIFGFSFNAISLIWASSMLFTYSWIPWIFMAKNSLKENRRVGFLSLSSALAMQLSAGYPIFFYLTLLTLLVETLFEIKRERNSKRTGAIGLGAVVTAFLYNASWLVPFREMIPFSNLAQRASFSETLGWNDLASWLNPFLKGHPLYSPTDPPFSVTVYFAGLPLLVLMIWGGVNRRIKPSTLFIFLVILILSLGETVFVGGWLKELLPGYSLLVRSGYWIPFVIWAALGIFLEVAVENQEEKKSELATFSWILLTFSVYGAALAAGVPWDLSSFWFSFCFILAVGLSRIFSPGLRQTFLALSLLFSLWPMAQNINFTMDRSYYEDKPPILSKMPLSGRLYESSETVDALKTISGNSVADAYEKLKRAICPNSTLAWDREEVAYANSLFLKSFLKWYLWTDHTDLPTAHKLLDFLNVRYRIGYSPFPNPHLSKDFGNPDPIFENDTSLSKWFSVEKAFPLPQGMDGGEEMLGPSFHFDKECIIADASRGGDYHRRPVEEVGRTANSVHLKAPGEGKVLLVSSEAAYPGWRAQVGGKDQPVELINQAFRGIVLAVGEEQAILTYAPTSFRLGCFISLCICGMWFWMILGIARGRYA